MPQPKRLPRAAVVVAAAASTTLFAGPASAAATGAAKVSGTTVVFSAAPGAVNSVVVTMKNNTITIDDRVAVKAGAGCKAVKGDKTKVTCTTGKRPTLVKAALGD